MIPVRILASIRHCSNSRRPGENGRKKRGQEGSVENHNLTLNVSGFLAEIAIMSITSKSPLAILVTAFEIAADALPAYSHANIPKKYTQHQIFACLVLKSSMKLDYRGVCGLLRDSPDLRWK